MHAMHAPQVQWAKFITSTLHRSNRAKDEKVNQGERDPTAISNGDIASRFCGRGPGRRVQIQRWRQLDRGLRIFVCFPQAWSRVGGRSTNVHAILRFFYRFGASRSCGGQASDLAHKTRRPHHPLSADWCMKKEHVTSLFHLSYRSISYPKQYQPSLLII